MRIGPSAVAVAAATGLAATAIALTAIPAAATGHAQHGTSATSLSTIWCTYTVNRAAGLPIHTAPKSSSPVTYTVPNHANVTAQQAITNGYRHGSYGSHSGYMSAAYLINQRACFE